MMLYRVLIPSVYIVPWTQENSNLSVRTGGSFDEVFRAIHDFSPTPVSINTSAIKGADIIVHTCVDHSGQLGNTQFPVSAVEIVINRAVCILSGAPKNRQQPRLEGLIDDWLQHFFARRTP
jgi:hypothetical protein